MTRQIASMTDYELTHYMGQLGDVIESLMPEEACFAVLVFGYPEAVQYLSTAERADTIKAMRECADRLEKGLTNERVPWPRERRGAGESTLPGPGRDG